MSAKIRHFLEFEFARFQKRGQLKGSEPGQRHRGLRQPSGREKMRQQSEGNQDSSRD
jgi:hypothetical protein